MLNTSDKYIKNLSNNKRDSDHQYMRLNHKVKGKKLLKKGIYYIKQTVFSFREIKKVFITLNKQKLLLDS